MRFFTIFLTVFLLAGCTASNQNTDDGWTYLLEDGIEDWVLLNGEAEYHLEDGVLVGVTKSNTPNSFLSPPGEYGDFILEYEALLDPRINSGVQIRSLSLPEYRDGRVHGYQVELDPSDRAWTAGIYDEARRGWLYDLEDNPKAQQAFKQNEWNAIRVEAIGDTIRTWLNGQMAAHLVDDMTPSGLIAFQVHAIRDPELEGAEIRWRNIRIKTDNLEADRWPVDPDVPARTAPEEETSN